MQVGIAAPVERITATATAPVLPPQYPDLHSRLRTTPHTAAHTAKEVTLEAMVMPRSRSNALESITRSSLHMHAGVGVHANYRCKCVCGGDVRRRLSAWRGGGVGMGRGCCTPRATHATTISAPTTHHT